MRIVTDFREEPAFEVLAPADQRLPFVFNSPHSGHCYPHGFLAASRLDALAIRRSEDAYVDELFASVVPLGAPMLRAHFPRAYLDVNREPYELDPKMFDGRLPSYANVRSIRVAGGLGTIARVVSESQEIYAGRLPVDEAMYRIEEIYKPYHNTLRRLLAHTHVAFGYAVLIDCHSMPSSVRCQTTGTRPDFILGDRYGTSCPVELTDAAATILKAKGYTVSRNKPYAGGFITEHYGRPAKGLHALQIEINRGLYMDEATHERTPGFDALARDLADFAFELTAMPDGAFATGAIAAE
ncbi:N-formylglutamate amidohydrolase [Polymorphum gilvum]|uniref:N-formylglutamate amidohydrolase superfamily n=1 Tax=Polymorphum gilvum (strain LMG 25793 / CGMCC 1.9160 / SL003B-26A1) TaxID=991905 RepID=F2IWI9_POLGS|nr:N-formylglutamate amidohydrolase [Polymorphum gilvum]ADZ69288.1 N-formylglutamate amidohydrolase superfamily [Polymorphum gilvum SL003B-26A1]